MATYAKLKDGSWGVKVEGAAIVGQSIIVTKKSGETKSEKVSRILWTDGKTTLCAITQSANGHSSGSRPGKCSECGTPCNPKYRYCYSCGLEHRDGGSMAHGGMSYYDRHGNFVLGDDD